MAAGCGNVQGIIVDPGGLAVSRAKVVIGSPDRRAERSAESNASGIFDFPDIDCGNWSISVEAQGFRRALVSPVLVHVDQTVHVSVPLVVGIVSETVQVTAHSDAALHVIENPAIASMPLNGRQYLDLALLTPGLTPAAPGTQGGGFNSSGIRSQSNVYLLDGISNIDTQTNQPLNLFRITEAVSEFDVQTGAKPAQDGRGAGAQVNVITRSGTEDFRGTIFEYLRNTRLNASDFFTNKLGGTKGSLERNQYGAAIGGPVIKNQTFFFASWEGFRQAAGAVNSTLAPTAAQRSTVTDPISQKLLAWLPLPNATGSLNYISNVSNLDSDDTALFRLDHRAGPRDQLAARWTQYWGQSTVGGTTALTGGNKGPISQVSAMLNDTHVVSPSFIDDLRFGYSRYVVQRLPQDAGFDATTVFGNVSGLTSGLPTIAIGGGFAGIGTNANFPQGRIANTLELFNDSSLIASAGHTRHTIRWGVHVRREDLSRYLNRAERGTINFSTFADFAKGQINTSTFRTGNTQAYWRRYPLAFYAQDEWRVSENLTFSFGLRYEYPSAATELRGHAVNFVPGYGPMIAGTSKILDIDPGLKGPASLIYRDAPFTLPGSGVYSDNNNFAPAAGFAWNRASTVIRGGIRLAYDDLFNNVSSAMALNAPSSLQTTQTANVTQPGKFPWATAFDQNVPLISNYGQQGPGTPTTGVLTFQGVDPNLRSAYAWLYNLNAERRAGRFITLNAGYSGSSGHKLGIYTDINQPAVIVRDPTKRGPVAPNEQVYPYNHFGQIQLAKSIGNSNYNGLIASARYRAHDAWAQVSYVFGKSLDYNSSYFGSGSLPGETGAPVDNRNLRLEHGPSAFDVRHRLVATGTLDVPHSHGLQLSSIATWQSGVPFTVVTGGQDSSGFNQAIGGISPQGGNRPNLAKSGRLIQDNGNPDAAFDPSWFTAALAGQDGTSGRNQYYGPGLANLDLAVSKAFAIPRHEGIFLQLRGDFFNTFNHTDFANPVADLSNVNFGKITQTLGSAAGTSAATSGGVTGGSRIIQISLRVKF